MLRRDRGEKAPTVGPGLFLPIIDFYGYNVGNLVQLMRGGQFLTVIWRGYILMTPLEGLSYRETVCRLDNGHWDCYYDEELTALGKW